MSRRDPVARGASSMAVGHRNNIVIYFCVPELMVIDATCHAIICYEETFV